MRIAIILLILVALFWGVVLWRAARHEARAEAAFPPVGQLLDVDGTQVHALVIGSGPDVVLIHGSNGNTRDMTFALAPALADRYRVIIFDRPGLGFSDSFDPDGESIREQADLLKRAADQLGASAPILVGHSYGGAVALAWAVHHPDSLSALVPVSAASNPWTTPLDPLYRVTSHPLGSAIAVPLITAFVPDTYVTQALGPVFEPQTVPEGYSAHFGSGLTLRRGSLRANALQRRNLLDEIKALQPRYGEIKVPTEILHGTADDTVNADLHSVNLSRQIPGAALTLLDGIGHMPQHVAAPDVAAAIDRAAARAGLR
ncbi:MAG: alpha/beta fold hydrolase [Ruegeria sp.]|uniref:alpha/beta fold hydrolase n=1 Tax=Ruegeria sp. TaxID=1879320 RepID=UPI00349E94FA